MTDSDVETVFSSWMIRVELPELQEKFPDDPDPGLDMTGSVLSTQVSACPELKKVLYAMIEGLHDAGFEANVVLTEVREK